ncbi:MAG: NAD(P)-binding domain-containing protein, partial [Rhizomicrobium sp.]
MFEKLALIGLGLIGSSLSHAVRRQGLAGEIAGYDSDDRVCKRAAELKLATIAATPADAVAGADLVI